MLAGHVGLGTVDQGMNHLEDTLEGRSCRAQEQSGPRLPEGTVFAALRCGRPDPCGWCPAGLVCAGQEWGGRRAEV